MGWSQWGKFIVFHELKYLSSYLAATFLQQPFYTKMIEFVNLYDCQDYFHTHVKCALCNSLQCAPTDTCTEKEKNQFTAQDEGRILIACLVFGCCFGLIAYLVWRWQRRSGRMNPRHQSYSEKLTNRFSQGQKRKSHRKLKKSKSHGESQPHPQTLTLLPFKSAPLSNAHPWVMPRWSKIERRLLSVYWKREGWWKTASTSQHVKHVGRHGWSPVFCKTRHRSVVVPALTRLMLD